MTFRSLKVKHTAVKAALRNHSLSRNDGAERTSHRFMRLHDDDSSAVNAGGHRTNTLKPLRAGADSRRASSSFHRQMHGEQGEYVG